MQVEWNSLAGTSLEQLRGIENMLITKTVESEWLSHWREKITSLGVLINILKQSREIKKNLVGSI